MSKVVALPRLMVVRAGFSNLLEASIGNVLRRRSLGGRRSRAAGVGGELGGGGCERGSRSLEWVSRRANQRGYKERWARAFGPVCVGGKVVKRKQGHPLTSLSENDKLVGCH